MYVCTSGGRMNAELVHTYVYYRLDITMATALCRLMRFTDQLQ